MSKTGRREYTFFEALKQQQISHILEISILLGKK